MAALAGLVGHGGAGGAVVETLVVLTIVGVFFAVWLRERRARSSDEEGGDEDQSKPQ